MPDRIKFHLDEHMDPDIAAALRAYGIDVTTTLEMGLCSRDDQLHLEFAKRARRVVVTDDTDFLRMATIDPDHDGIVFCRRTKHTLGEIIQFLLLVHGVYDANEMRGRVEFV